MTLNFFVFIFGAVIGSFVNVLIYRLPRGISVVTPRSQCTSCKKMISWYENIPIVSYLALKGRCSGCKSKISWKYPLVEFLCGVFSLVLFPNTSSAFGFFYYAVFFSTLAVFLALFIIDLEFQILPDVLNLYLGVIFLLYSVIHHGWLHWVLGGVIGFVIPYGVTWIFYKLKGKIGLGGGDIKLFAALGILFGPIGIIHNIFLSCFTGALIGLILIAFKKMSRDTAIPFGPFIIIAALVQIFYPSLLHFIFLSWP